jgi:hypothetical protein
MNESGVYKEPGCSSIELNNKVYEFLVGDGSHPKRRRYIQSWISQVL